MPGTCVVGLQWGDEAKGKIVDILGDQHDIVVRYNGGANAGHTIVWEDRTFKLSLLPTGILKPHVLSVIGNGVVIYPPRLLEEISQLATAGIPVGDNLKISHHAHVIFPYHMEEERVSESGSSSAIGTTGRGIGPCYQDKSGRVCAIRLGDLYHPAYFRERLEALVPRKNQWIRALAGEQEHKQFDVDGLFQEYSGYAEQLRPYVTDTVHLLHEKLNSGSKLLFEAAQGSLLDVDHGSYPFVTSSTTMPASIWSGSGVPARNVDRIIGIVKAYTSRVGRGAFPTELVNDLGDHIRKVGREYGTVTGRPRRVGWLDAVALKYTAMIAGVDEITVMLLDVLTGIDELKIATAYELDGRLLTEFPGDSHLLECCKPVFETLPGWREDITGVQDYAALPANARQYVERISELLMKPLAYVSVGPGRKQTFIPPRRN
jgi:adenylosuccinate synthase